MTYHSLSRGGTGSRNGRPSARCGDLTLSEFLGGAVISLCSGSQLERPDISNLGSLAGCVVPSVSGVVSAYYPMRVRECREA